MYKWKPNEYEEKLIEAIEEIKEYCKGELEFDLFEDGWHAMDYRESYEAAFSINSDKYHKPLITEETAQKYNIDVRKCCDYCDIWMVG